MLPATRWATGSPPPRCWSNSWVFSGMPSTPSSIVSRDRQRWYAECLETIASRLRSGRYDVIFCFHSFWPFASEVRRIVDDARRSVPIVAYNHGSHWDPTDAFRQERYPALRWADLGNLLAVDAVLLVSDYMRATLLREVGGASAEAAAQLAARLWVVGLPIDTGLLDACLTEKEQAPTVVFNHSFSEGKRPGAFLEVAEEVLERRPARIVITRGAPVDSPHRARLSRLAKRFGSRVTVGETLAIPDYFRALWGSHVQVSTATHESLGIATLEAMYARNYCLLPDLGAYPEVVGPVREALYDPKRRAPRRSNRGGDRRSRGACRRGRSARGAGRPLPPGRHRGARWRRSFVGVPRPVILAATRAPGKLEQVWAPFTTGLASFSPPIRLDKRATGLSDPVPFRQITGEGRSRGRAVSA